MGWKDLSAEQRAEVFHRHSVLKEPLMDLAVEYDVYVETLSRELRRYRQQMMEREGIRRPSATKEPEVEVHDNGNNREIESNGDRITNLEELLAACNVDTDTWIVERHVINKWEVGAKDPMSGMILVEPLFQVKAWLVRREPVAIHPVIQPINIKITPTKPAPRKRGMKAAMIFPDPQFGFSRSVHKGTLTPFHDRLALDVARQIVEDVEPDVVGFLGDLVDFAGWSDKWVRRPEFYFTTQPALIETSWYLGQVRKRVSGWMFAIEGNHDIRPETMMITHLLEAYQLRAGDLIKAPHLLSMDNLLGLSRMGIEYIEDYPNGEAWLNDSTRCIHGDKVKAGSGMTAAALVKEITDTTIYGHIHRMEMAMRTIRTHNGYKTVTAFSPGCLCHIDGRVPGSTANNNWQQGAAIVWFNDEHSVIEPIHIVNGTAVYNGEMYVGEDYTENLVRDTEWEF